jgi:ribosomal protein L22
MTEEERQSTEGQSTEEAPEATEEAPKKPRRTRRKKADEASGPEAGAEETPEAEAADEPEAEADAEEPEAEEADEPEAEEADEPEAEEADEPEAEEADEPEAEEKPRRGRRRSSETSAPAKEPVHKKSPAPRAADGTVVVRAQAKYVRHAPRKARLVVDHIRGKSVDDARAILRHTPRAAAVDVLKLLDSAVANAENNHELVADDLIIHKAYVDEGPTLKRYRPRALGRATRIRKRTSHMTIQLSPKE